jgi:hypothetical protein
VADETIIDECIGTLIVIVFFLSSSVLSYISMRAKRKSELYEKIADSIFLAGLCLLTPVSLVIK